MKKSLRYYRANSVEINAKRAAWRAVNRIKIKAHNAVKYAIAKGVLIPKLTCERCPSTKSVHAHHADYSQPLSVEWLCRKCHYEEHGALTFCKFVKRRFRGEKSATAKLTDQNAIDIRALFATGNYSKRALGRQFGVGETTIRLLIKGETWKHLKK